MKRMRSLNSHWTSKHGTMVPKLQFKTLGDVLSYMNEHHINKDVYNPYVCPDCGMWHIGHRNKKKK